MQFYKWQKEKIEQGERYPKRGLFASPRTGKTLVGGTLLQEWAVPSLVVAPLSVCGAWEAQLHDLGMEVLPAYRNSVVGVSRALSWDAIVVLNYDKLTQLQGLLRPSAIVFDESHFLKNPQSQRSKAARKIARGATYVRTLTGTPAPNHYGDLWGQMTLVNPRSWGTKFNDFAKRFLIRDAVYPSKIVGHKNVEELQAMLLADADIVRRTDVFGPDTYQVVERWVTMPYNAQQAYNKLVAEWVLRVKEGEVLADHALKRLIRLQQITSGYLRTEMDQNVPLHTAKLNAVLSDLGEIVESGEKTVIFHRFTWEGDLYERALQNEFRGLRVWRINGSTPAAARTSIIGLFADYEGPCVVVAQTQAAGTGISFAEATHAMFVSQSFSFTEEEQAKDRIYKPGQNRCITYYRCANTVDTFIAKKLALKTDIHHAVTYADIEEMAYGLGGN